MIQSLVKAIHTEYGRILISILLGLGVASLFRKSCKSADCFKFKSPSVKGIDGEIFRHGGTCHKFRAVTKNCELPIEKRVTFQ
jgi:hypothetical protein